MTKLYKKVSWEDWKKQYPGKHYHEVYPDEPKGVDAYILVPVEDEWVSEKQKRLDYLESLINNPEIEDFLEGVKLEAAHQTERWGVEYEENKYPHDYTLVMDKLKGKQAIAIWDKDSEKYKHHLITLAAVCFNAHRQIKKEGTRMNEFFTPTPITN